MDADQIQRLSPEQRGLYKQLEDVFGMPGWKIIVQWAAQNMQDQHNRAALATSWDANRLNVGAAAAFGRMVALRDAMETEYAALAEQAKEASDVEAESLFE